MIRPADIAIIRALRNLLHMVQMVIPPSIRDYLAGFTMRQTALATLADWTCVNH